MKYSSYDQIDFLSGIKKIAKQVRDSGWYPEYIVAMARGGAVAGVYLSHELDVPVIIVNLSTRHHWAEDIKADVKSPLISKILKEKMQVLIIDDIVDSGKTIKTLLDKWKVKTYNDNQIKVASLIYNNTQSVKVSFYDKLIDRDLDDSWYIFPWELENAGGLKALNPHKIFCVLSNLLRRGKRWLNIFLLKLTGTLGR